MRASIPHPRLRRRPWRSARHPFTERQEPSPDPSATAVNPFARVPDPAALPPDPAVMRVRRAGGPVDQASYTCACGYVFTAPVSTSVCCPHCEASQPW